MAEEVATSRSGIGVAVLSFLLGFWLLWRSRICSSLVTRWKLSSGGTLGAMLIVTRCPLAWVC